jgi:acyl-CoA dehydrogenase
MELVFATEKLAALLPRIQQFVETELLPLEAQFSYRDLGAIIAQLHEKREKVKAAGLWGLQLPEESGGFGLTLCEFGQVSEALARAPLFGHYVFNCQAPDIGNMELIAKFGSPAVKERFLQPLMEGRIRSCFSMTEPAFAGSNPTRMATSAKREGDYYRVNGHKWFTSAADGAAFAVVMAVTDPAAPPHRRASMIIVPAEAPGFEIVRNIPVFGEAGQGWFSHAEVRYHDCRVPAGYLIGQEGQGFQLAQERLGPGRVHHCMRWIGAAERALDMMCRRAATREIDEGVMLGEKQFIQGFIAESRIDIDAARMLVLRAAHYIDRHGQKAAREQIAGIKVFAANMFLRVLDRAIQVHGAEGLTDDLILAALYRHERGARIWDGADEVHKHTIARGILKKYGLDIRQKETALAAFRASLMEST